MRVADVYIYSEFLPVANSTTIMIDWAILHSILCKRVILFKSQYVNEFGIFMGIHFHVAKNTVDSKTAGSSKLRGS